MLHVGVIGRVSLERAGVRRVLEEDERIRVVGEGPADQSSLLVRTSRPNLLVTIHDSPSEALSMLRATAPALPSIVLVSHLTEQTTRMLLRRGANGILLREDSVSHLHWAVRAAAAGGLALAPTAAAFVTARLTRPDRPAEETVTALKLVALLSPREREILRFLEKGVANAETADTLNISGHTVKDHIRAIYAKLGVDNRVQAARIAWQADSGCSTGTDAQAGISAEPGARVGASATADAEARAGLSHTAASRGTGFRPSGAAMPHPYRR
ncbi:response regulator transcription factor [Streptomyces griseiscabiei]|uniref:Response regulator transcription factor n=1 Tax=Streptomyces griseiscabiei TaxID=2993540 RepID=A0ABU4L8F6_9ACTN|nr:response regulator transcription factor [Streptomyces griseiscabiei]MBZ3906830.1 response regulator transcription factor [Streptomyces griseiscabiei]MDX2911791.1 response regulator transcription factor [Streptomyces griseiscabiei]